MEEDLINVENNLNTAVKKLNLTFANTSAEIGKNLKEKLSSPLFAKYDTIELKFEENYQKMLNLVHQLDQYLNKYNNEFNKKYFISFNTFMQKYNELDNYLINMKDFFIIEYDIINEANQSILIATKFIKDIKVLYDESTTIFCDYLELLKTLVKLHYQENKKLIMSNILSEKMILDLEKLIGQDIRKSVARKFCIKNIIEYSHNEALINDMNHLLLKYKEILSRYKILKHGEFNDISHFNLRYFKTNEIFFNFLFSLIPQKFPVNYEEVIQFKSNVRRDCGFFQGWKDCFLVISYQGHILFFDDDTAMKSRISELINEIINEKDVDEFKNTTMPSMPRQYNEMQKRSIFSDAKLEDDFKRGEARYGIVPKKLSIMYYRTNYGIKKRNKKGKYLFEIFEKGVGNKKTRINVIDALSQKNYDNILLELMETNIVDD